jgi:hypothetical protein
MTVGLALVATMSLNSVMMITTAARAVDRL